MKAEDQYLFTSAGGIDWKKWKEGEKAVHHEPMTSVGEDRKWLVIIHWHHGKNFPSFFWEVVLSVLLFYWSYVLFAQLVLFSRFWIEVS